MLQIGRATNLIVERKPLLCGLLLAAILGLRPLSVQAQCTQWDAGGKWELQQSNGFTYQMELSQSGKAITGKASYWRVTKGTVFTGGDPVELTANVNGNIEGNDFYVMIGTSGVYRGTVGASGRLDGTTYDADKPSSKATWFSSRAMNCAPPPVESTPGPKVIRSSGRARRDTPAPPLKPPFITANQIIGQPYVPFASVNLAWDGGPDHPNVEVWVSIDNGAETPAFSIDFVPQHPVFKLPKAGIEMKLSKGRVYKYVLKAAGTTLSSVVVAIPH